MKWFICTVPAFALCLLVFGCGREAPTLAASPLVGTWSGKSEMKDKGVGSFANALAGGPLTGPSSLTLQADGTGFLKVADAPERPIAWKQEGRKVLLESRSIKEGSEASGSTGTKAYDVRTYVGTLSEDERTLTIDMGPNRIVLNQQLEAS